MTQPMKTHYCCETESERRYTEECLLSCATSYLSRTHSHASFSVSRPIRSYALWISCFVCFITA